jgi:ADP-ribose pyrophosphatase
VLPLEDALDAVKDGRINNAASIIALQWLALNRAEVRGLWS